MPQITCPNCQQPYMIPPEQWPQYQGRQINCTKCNQPFDVIDPSAPPAPPPMAAPVGYAQGGYAPPGMMPPSKGMSGGKIALLVCGIVVLVLLVCGGALTAILVPSLSRAREAANRVKSASNLRQIGMAALMYSNSDKEGHFPDDLKTMIKTQDITINVFVSPRTTTVMPMSGDPGQQGDWANSHSDYAWVGAGITSMAGGTTVIAYEKPDGLTDGVEVLFADGHVEFEQMPRAQAIISDLKQGKNPPAILTQP